jgi:broad specificity phosphatase PhoE
MLIYFPENSSKPCDTGSALSSLEKEFPNVDFSHVDPVYPDKTSPAGSHYAYTKKALLNRAQLSLEDLYKCPEKVIVVVSHSGFMRQAMTGYWFFNGDYRTFDFEERDELNGPYRLKQREETLKGGGGMGWSWNETVEIGDGLPDEWPTVES